MKLYEIIIFVCIGYHFLVFASYLSVSTHLDHLLLSWNPPPNPPEEWTITYNVLGTSFHSVLTVPGNSNSAMIYTGDYPGVLYMIKLFESTQGEKIYKGTTFGRSDCSIYINTTIGSSYSFESFGYPGCLASGAICTWTFTGSNNTWYKFELEDFDIGISSCNSYLMVGEEKFCGNETVNGTLMVNQRAFVAKLAYRDDGSNRGVKFQVLAIHKLLPPAHLTASNIDNYIHVEWQQPIYHPDRFTYVLRISHFPFLSHVDVTVDGNITKYVYHVINHVGQNFSMQLQSVSKDLESTFTDPVFVSSNCDKDIFIKATEKSAVVSEQYPFRYLPEVSCNFRVQTEADFYLLILTHDLDIGRGQMCDKTFLEIENFSKFCADAPPPSKLIIKKASVDMLFRTYGQVDGNGINITVVSVAQPPHAPTNVLATSEETYIHVAWKPPPFQRNYIEGYFVQYFLAPNTPGATLSLDKDAHNVTIETRSHPGRLYAMRIAAFSGGGVGNFSHPFYVRAGCGHRFHLLRHDAVNITSPSNVNGYYEPNTVCVWVIKVESPLWLRMIINKLQIEGSNNCSKDYVVVTGVTGRMCGSQMPNITVVKHTEMVITFRSDNDIESKGFSMSVEATGTTPGTPKGVNVSQTVYGIVIMWMPPTIHRRFVAGYLIHINFYGESSGMTHRVGPNTHYHVVDMTSHPGRLVEVSLQTEGDVEHSNATKSVFIRTACGQSVNVSDSIYITSPYYESGGYAHVQCRWTLYAPNQFHLRVEFIRLNINNIKNCENFIRINKRLFCDDSYESSSVEFNTTMSVILDWHTGQSAEGAFFLLRVVSVPRSELFSSASMSSCSDTTFTSTPVLMTSYLGTLLVSTLMTSTVLSPNTTEESTDSSLAIIQQNTPRNNEKNYLHGSQTLATAISTDKIHSRERDIIRQTVLGVDSQANVVKDINTFILQLDSASDHGISPTRTSSFLVSTYQYNSKGELLLLNSSSFKKSFKISVSDTLTSMSIGTINPGAGSISRTVELKNTKTSYLLDSSEVSADTSKKSYSIPLLFASHFSAVSLTCVSSVSTRLRDHACIHIYRNGE